MRKKFLPVLIIVFMVFRLAYAQDEPLGILLTWTEDPATTISIDWHTRERQSEKLYYRESGTTDWKNKSSETHIFPFSERYVHRVALNRLKPGTSYQIRFGEYQTVYTFRTMPDQATEPIKIAIGGDTMHARELLEKTNSQVAMQDPDFVIMGGDLAYENGSARNVERVFDWFEACKNTLITENNRIIPIVAAIGNHEVAVGYYSSRRFSGSDQDRERYAPYFYSLFAFPGQPGYNVLDFGDYLSLFILDSGHTNSISGKQARWLESELGKRDKVMHIIPVYHVPAYPSVRRYNRRLPRNIRRHWLPLFENHNVSVAFENHDHAYKRTPPIKNRRVDEAGIVYIGDGAWGVRVRETHPAASTWYLEKAIAQRHFVLLTIHGSHQQITAFDDLGQVIDTYP